MRADEDQPGANGPIASPVESQSTDPLLKLAGFWYVWLPMRTRRWSASLASALSDGTWTTVFPAVGALIPIAAFVAGILAALLWPMDVPFPRVYTESLSLMAAMLFVAFFSGTAAVMLLLGYVAADVPRAFSGSAFYYGWLVNYDLPERVVRAVGGPLIGYLLLAIVIIQVPRWSRQLSVDTATRLGFSPIGAILLYGSIALVFVYGWSQAAILLVGPAFTWVEVGPTPSAVRNLQFGWPWLLASTVIAIALRGILTMRLASEADRVAGAVRLRLTAWSKRDELAGDRKPSLAGVAARALVVTFILSGAYLGVLEALGVAVALLLLGAWHAGFLGGVPTRWVNLMSRVPALLRFLVALIAGLAISVAVASALWEVHQNVRLVLLGVILSLTFFYVLFPRPVPERPAGEASAA